MRFTTTNDHKLDWFGWAALTVLFVAPVPLGSNRPWAVAFLFAAQVTLAAIFLVRYHTQQRTLSNRTRLLLGLLAMWVVIPFLQLLPVPIGLLQWLSPGAALVWGAELGRLYAPISLSPGDTAEQGFYQLGVVLFAFVLLELFRQPAFRQTFVRLLVLIGAINAIFGLLNVFAGAGMEFFRPATAGLKALTGTYVNKNHFAGLIALTLPFAIGLFLREKRSVDGEGLSHKLLWLWGGATGLLAVSLILSGSRGGLLAVTLAGLAVLLVFSPSWGNFAKRLAAFVGLPVILLMVFLSFVGWETVWNMYVARELDPGRIIIYSDSLSLLPDYWWLGGGAGSFEFLYPIAKSAELGPGRLDHAHNDFIEILLTTGFVGLFVFLTPLLMVLSRVLSHRGGVMPEHYEIISGLWAVGSLLIHGLVDFNLQIPSNYLLFVSILMFLWRTGKPVVYHQQGESARL